MKNVEIIIELLEEDRVLCHIKLRKGFRAEKNETFNVQFFDNETMELLYKDDNIKFGMFAGCTRRDQDVLIKVKNRGIEIYRNVISKLEIGES